MVWGMAGEGEGGRVRVLVLDRCEKGWVGEVDVRGMVRAREVESR